MSILKKGRIIRLNTGGLEHPVIIHSVKPNEFVTLQYYGGAGQFRLDAHEFDRLRPFDRDLSSFLDFNDRKFINNFWVYRYYLKANPEDKDWFAGGYVSAYTEIENAMILDEAIVSGNVRLSNSVIRDQSIIRGSKDLELRIASSFFSGKGSLETSATGIQHIQSVEVSDFGKIIVGQNNQHVKKLKCSGTNTINLIKENGL